jgi:hypothetical protein
MSVVVFLRGGRTIMMATKGRNFSPLKDLSLEELVSKDNFYHRLERTVDLSIVWELVRDRYASVRLRIRFISKQNRNSRRMDVLRTAVSKLINTYIGGTLFAVFRNPTFLVHLERASCRRETILES